MTSKLDIANRSLLAVGARSQISSLSPSDGSVEADTITTLWQPTFEQLGRAAQWNCLTKQATLSLLQAASGTPENPDGTSYDQPPTPWLYAYSYPSDCLAVRYIIPSLPINETGTTPATTINNAAGIWIPTGGQIPFQVMTEYTANNSPYLVILTNQSQAQISYTVNESNPAVWDSLFQAAMVASLGAFLVPALSLDMNLMTLCIRQAEGSIKQARASDGNEGVTTMDHLPDWMQARAGAQGFGGYNFSLWGGYVNVSWPGYGV